MAPLLLYILYGSTEVRTDTVRVRVLIPVGGSTEVREEYDESPRDQL